MSLRCPHCGWITWEDAPAAGETFALLQKRGSLTSRQAARDLDLSIQAASNRLAKLEELGAAHVERTRGAFGGGREKVYTPADVNVPEGVDLDVESSTPWTVPLSSGGQADE